MHWEDLAGKIGDQFEIGTLASSVNESLLRKAKALYAESNSAPSGVFVHGAATGSQDVDRGSGSSKGREQRQWNSAWTGKRKWDEGSKDGSKKPKSLESIKCFGCKQYGHLLQDCLKKKKYD